MHICLPSETPSTCVSYESVGEDDLSCRSGNAIASCSFVYSWMARRGSIAAKVGSDELSIASRGSARGAYGERIA